MADFTTLPENVGPDNGFRVTPEAVLRIRTWWLRRYATRWNETYAKIHFVTAVVICFSGNAKTTRGDSL